MTGVSPSLTWLGSLQRKQIHWSGGMCTREMLWAMSGHSEEAVIWKPKRALPTEVDISIHELYLLELGKNESDIWASQTEQSVKATYYTNTLPLPLALIRLHIQERLHLWLWENSPLPRQKLTFPEFQVAVGISAPAHENLAFYMPKFPPVGARNMRPFWWASAKGEQTEFLVPNWARSNERGAGPVPLAIQWYCNTGPSLSGH